MNQKMKNDNELQTMPLLFCFKKLKVLLKQSQVNLVQGMSTFIVLKREMSPCQRQCATF